MISLAKSDKVAILSPASIINPDFVKGAVETLTQWGLEPMVMPHTLGESGSFSGTAEERLADFREALLNPEVKAIICSRGGYGCVHLLPQLDELMAKEAPQEKWLVGFSDITALHGLWARHGWQSVHASMTKHLTLGGPSDALNLQLLSILKGEKPQLAFPTGISGSEFSKVNRQGVAEGMVVGGNMAVFGGLLGTPYSPIKPGTILVIEDIAEPIYKIERILYQLRLAGILDNLAGLIVGQFTEYKAPSRDHADMYAMISKMVEGVKFPIAMDVPIGHIDRNQPVLLNAQARLTVTADCATLSYL
jgi:muramoyltetrapeptide carboxypeptidase